VKQLTTNLLFLLIVCSSLLAQVPQLPTTPSEQLTQQLSATKTPSTARELSASDVEAFLDGAVPLQLQRDDIAGATIAVVKDGQLLLAKGYGYADVEKRKPVMADETLFRPGSTSKLFTWTAVMQLYEQGKLDLDRDVNEYLDFKIPEAFGKPITLKNILTHTPGFEEQIKDLFTDDATRIDLGQYLKTHIPARIYPPGTVPAYSNYATALAGYIVERISGKPFNDYIDQNIFQPLGMTRSTFVQPLPEHLKGLMSNGYQTASDGAKQFELVSPFPAGSLSSSASDMAKFMIAHLQDGQSGNVSILKPETAKLMHSRLFGLDDSANAMCYGFYEESKNGQRIIGHAGDTLYFHSDLHLILDKGVGFFISYNSAGRGDVAARITLWDAFLNRYFPYQPVEATAPASAKEDANAITGSYILSRRAETSFLRTASLISEFDVYPTNDGMIEVAQLTQANGKPKKWKEVGPMVFVEENGSEKLVFKPDQSGRLQMIMPYPFFVGQRVGILENKKVLLPVLGASLVIMLLALVLWPVSWLVRRHYGHKLELSRKELLMRIAVRAVLALDLIFVIVVSILVIYGLTHLWIFSDRGTVWFRLVQILGVLGAIGTVVVLLNAGQSWLNRSKRIWGKLQATILLLACLGFLWFVLMGKLLSFPSNY
jgi:CubicO group peptidase (beta-lactamase class C family)